MKWFPRPRSQLVQTLGGENELGVFRKPQVSVMFGENREQAVRDQAWNGNLRSWASFLMVAGAMEGL